MKKELRDRLVEMALGAQKKITPLEGYVVDLGKKGLFMVVLGNRPPKAFTSDDVPLDMDTVFEIKR